MWWFFGLTGLLAHVTGVVDLNALVALLQRIGPVLVFLVCVTVLADVAATAELFKTLAASAARAAGGRAWLLYLLIMLLATLTTIVFSLDTTAVLVTPVVITVARLTCQPVWPYAVGVLWLANTGSLLLPVSNLTNLLAMDDLGWSTYAYVGRMWPAALAAIVLTLLALVARFGSALRGTYRVPEWHRPGHRGLHGWAAAAVGVFVVLIALNVPPWKAALIAAAIAAIAMVITHSVHEVMRLFPWQLVITTIGLFVTIEAVGRLGLQERVHDVLAAHPGPYGVSLLAGALANIVNNLPAYLLVESAVPASALPHALLGVNLAPIVTPWASLATLLWAERCRRAGERVRWAELMGLGALLAPLLLVATVPLL